MIKINNSKYGTYLKSGTYHLYIEPQDQTSYRKVDITMTRKEVLNGLMVDPGEGWLCGSQISMYDEIFSDDSSFNDTNIIEGFTRILYPYVYAPSSSRLNYEFFSSDESVASVTRYGTVLAKETQIDKTVVICAVYKYNPDIVYTIEFTNKKHDPNNDLSINFTKTYDTGYREYMDIGEYLPYNFLQYYRWSSSDPSVVTIDSLGLIETLTPGKATITGEYKLNENVTISIHIIVT